MLGLIGFRSKQRKDGPATTGCDPGDPAGDRSVKLLVDFEGSDKVDWETHSQMIQAYVDTLNQQSAEITRLWNAVASLCSPRNLPCMIPQDYAFEALLPENVKASRNPDTVERRATR